MRLTPGLLFRTGGDATLVRQDSVLKVSTAQYTHGAIRRLQLTQGSVVVQVDSLHRDASFELTTGTARVFCRPSLTSVRALPTGKKLWQHPAPDAFWETPLYPLSNGFVASAPRPSPASSMAHRRHSPRSTVRVAPSPSP